MGLNGPVRSHLTHHNITMTDRRPEPPALQIGLENHKMSAIQTLKRGTGAIWILAPTYYSTVGRTKICGGGK